MSEFARPMTPAEAKRQTEPLHLVADMNERAAIAARFDLISVDRLEASGEPVPATINTPIAVRFVPLAALEAAQEDAEIELAGDDLDVVGFSGGRFDVGEMVAESLALELDPYPRSPEAERFLKERGVKSEGEVGSFAALAALLPRSIDPQP